MPVISLPVISLHIKRPVPAFSRTKCGIGILGVALCFVVWHRHNALNAWSRFVSKFLWSRPYVIHTIGARLRVSIYEGDLLTEKVDVIACATNTSLDLGHGLAGVITEKGGRELASACNDLIRQSRGRPLNIGDVMHTTSGKLYPNIRCVIFVVGPVAGRSSGDVQLRSDLVKTFYNCLCYANDTLGMQSIAIPALCSGYNRVSTKLVAEAAYEALVLFDHHVTHDYRKYLDEIRFVNVDGETNKTFVSTFKAARQRYLLGPPAGSVLADVDVDLGKQPKDIKKRLRQLKPPSQSISVEQSSTSIQFNTNRLEDVSVEIAVGTRYDDRVNVGESFTKVSSYEEVFEGDRDQPTDGRIMDFGIRSASGEEDTNDAVEYWHQDDEVEERWMVDRNYEKATSPQNMKQPLNKPLMSVCTQSAPLSAKDTDDTDEDCVICMCPMTSPHRLPCGHSFCQDCIRQSFDKCGEKCPSCGRLFGVQRGNQPPGTMTDYIDAHMQLAGYRGYDTIAVTYDIPDGVQSDDHPNPGQPYTGTHRTAYLPNNAEGREVLGLLKRAFDTRVIFTIGRSVTTGADNVVVWNDIHHKTNDRGPYGYPDPTYLTRVKAELAAKGISPS